MEKIVRESISFERGKDPKEALGIGIFSPKNFNTYDDAGNFIIEHIEEILRKKKVPKNLIKTGDETWFLDEYYDILYDYIKKYMTNFGDRERDYILNYIHDFFKHIGFSKGYKEYDYEDS
jgi:hypothetical protein